MNNAHVPNMPLHLTIEDVAHYLRTDHTTITGWLENGNLPGYRLPDRWLITADDLQNYLTSRRNTHPLQEGHSRP